MSAADPLAALRVLVAFAATHTGDGATPEEGRLLDAYGEGVAEAVREGRKALADLDALLEAAWKDATDALNSGCPRCGSRTCDGGCAFPERANGGIEGAARRMDAALAWAYGGADFGRGKAPPQVHEAWVELSAALEREKGGAS